EALGAEYAGRPIGSHRPPCVFGLYPKQQVATGEGGGGGTHHEGGGERPPGVFGCYPNKQVATGEGGVVTTHDEEEWKLLRSLRNQGRSYEGGGWFNHVRLGFNYRWTDLQAAVGLAQLAKLDRMLGLRREAAERYNRLLGDVDGVSLAPADDERHPRAWVVCFVPLVQA